MEDDRSKCTSDLRQTDPGRSFGWRAAELSRITHGVGGKVEGVQGNDKKAKDMQEWVGGIDDKIDQVNGSGSPTSSRTAFPSKSPARYPHREPYTRPVTRSPFLRLGLCPCHAGRAQRFFKAVIDFRLLKMPIYNKRKSSRDRLSIPNQRTLFPDPVALGRAFSGLSFLTRVLRDFWESHWPHIFGFNPGFRYTSFGAWS